MGRSRYVVQHPESPSMKWRNSRGRRVKSRRLPVCHEFLLMFRGPFDDQAKRPRRQPSFANSKRRDLNRCSVTPIASVKVWWIVLVVVHRDHYAEKPRYFRHLSLPQFMAFIILIGDLSISGYATVSIITHHCDVLTLADNLKAKQSQSSEHSRFGRIDREFDHAAIPVSAKKL